MHPKNSLPRPLSHAPLAIVLTGISGAGKSTLARITWPSAIVVSADDYFTSNLNKPGVYDFDPSKLGLAHGACLRAFIAAMTPHAGMQPRTVVVDNTNTTSEELAPYYAVARAYGRDVWIVDVHADPVVAAARATHGAPAAAILAQHARMEARVLPPFWEVERIGVTVVDGKALCLDGTPFAQCRPEHLECLKGGQS